jgi:predicted enzyme related to lactoylglutathione lyase
MAHFWAAVLGYTLAPPPPEAPHDPSIAIQAPAEGLRIWFNKVPEPKVVKNRVHLDINMPDGAELERLQRLGARVLGEIRDAEERVRWIIMADPEGNEFCAFPPQS